MSISVLIGGDLCPIGEPAGLFQRGDSQTIFNDLVTEFKNSDISLLNLECPLIDKGIPIIKVGPALKAPASGINGIKNIGIDIVNLANNHIMDYGPEGLENTINICRSSKLNVVGVGKNIHEARKPLIKEINGIKIAFLAMVENEWSIASENKPGSNPLDLILFREFIIEYHNKYDRLVVLVHGGKENYPYPSPENQRVARFFVNEGADAVVFQHSHISGCYELYKDSPIVYGQGNLLFNKESGQPDYWDQGFLVKLVMAKEKGCDINIIPFSITETRQGIQKMQREKKEKFLQEINRRNKQILTKGFIEKQWKIICLSEERRYMRTFSNYNKLFSLFNRFIPIDRLLFRKDWKRRILSYIRCESHREAIISILEEKHIK